MDCWSHVFTDWSSPCWLPLFNEKSDALTANWSSHSLPAPRFRDVAFNFETHPYQRKCPRKTSTDESLRPFNYMLCKLHSYEAVPVFPKHHFAHHVSLEGSLFATLGGSLFGVRVSPNPKFKRFLKLGSRQSWPASLFPRANRDKGLILS